jgi:hypothetical protein
MLIPPLVTALLIVIGVAVCLAVQLLVHRYWFGLFLSVVTTMIAWVAASLVFALATAQPLVAPGQWSNLEAVLGAAFIAQCIARILALKRRLMGGK